MTKLNLGCGKDIKKGYINLDKVNIPGIDVIHDLTKFPWPFPNDYFDEILSLGTIELINADFIKIMEEIYRISKQGALIKIRSPVFPNMCSAQDPLTKKFMTYNSFDYFNPHWHYSNARFKIITKKYIFSLSSKLKWLSFIPNLAPKFYTRFLFNLFPSNCIYYELKTIK